MEAISRYWLFFINSWLHIYERVFDSGQTFGVTDKEDPFFFQVVIQSIYQILSGFFIKINHNVSAKNAIKGIIKRKRIHQVKPLELYD